MKDTKITEIAEAVGVVFTVLAAVCTVVGGVPKAMNKFAKIDDSTKSLKEG